MGHRLFYTDMRLTLYSNSLQDSEFWISNPKEILELFYFSPGLSIVILGSTGIPEWIRRQKKGSVVATKLPQYWYENSDFLGFALCYVYVHLMMNLRMRID